MSLVDATRRLSDILDVDVADRGAGTNGFALIWDDAADKFVLVNPLNLTNLSSLLDFWNGTFIESFDALVSSDGATITLSLEQDGGGDLTMVFSDGFSTLDCTPADTVSLTAGTDTVPQENFVYVLQSSKALTVSTTGWPATEHIKVCYVLVQSASTVQTTGPLVNQNWNDHMMGTDNQGHLSHMAERSRKLGAVYYSGGEITVSISTSPTPDEIDLAWTAATVYQMHKQTFPAFDTDSGDKIYVPNHNATPYTSSADLETLITSDSNGVSLGNKYFNIVLWAVANKSDESFSPVMCNLPSGGYTTLNDAINDTDGKDVFTIPDEFLRESSTGFLLHRLTLRFQSGTNTLTLEDTRDLRGANPISASGSSGTAPTLASLGDTLIIAPTNGQTLQYLAASSKWINAFYGIDDMSDVTITASSLVDKQRLEWDSGSNNWVNVDHEWDDVIDLLGGTGTLTGSYTPISWGTTEVAGTDFTLESNTQDVTIEVACRVHIHAQVTANFTGTASSTNANTLKARIEVNTGGGFAAINDTQGSAAVLPIGTAHEGTATCVCTYNASAGDKIRVTALKVRTTAVTDIDVVTEGCRLFVRQISDGS